MKYLFSILTNLQTHYDLKLDFQKAWDSLVWYPSSESKHDTNESEDNMLNPVYITLYDIWYVTIVTCRVFVQFHVGYSVLSTHIVVNHSVES